MLIKNGLVVTAAGSSVADVLVEDEKIVQVGLSISADADEVIDAAGKYIMPGAIDPHTHLAMPFMGVFSTDDYETGTIAAACGGVTSVIDFAIQAKGESIRELLDRKGALAEGKAVIDWSHHPGIVDPNPEVIAEIEKAVKEYGTPSFKIFMVYDFRVDDGTMIKLLEQTKLHGGLVQVHAENFYIIQHLNEKFAKEGKLDMYHHALSRPNRAEEEAIFRASELVETTGSSLYVVHLSSKEGLRQIQAARQKGLNVYTETCPQYLMLTDEEYKKPDFEGAKVVMSPPLRTAESNGALWDGLRSGDIQALATDHCPFHFHGIKDKFGKDDYKKVPNGAPGIETSLILMHSEGVVKGKISLEKLVEVTSTSTARIFGMDNKGAIAPGKDADIVIFDPDQKFTLATEKLHMNVDYTPFEGFELTGMPNKVFSRGKLISQWNSESGQMDFVGEAGWGKFVKRSPFKPL